MEGGGCNVLPPDSDTNSYGDPFNGAAGGIYAVEWTATDIKIWHWDRASVPQNIIDGEPDPSTWMTPQALFGTSSCDPDTYFKDMSIVLDIVSDGADALLIACTNKSRLRISAGTTPAAPGTRTCATLWRRKVPRTAASNTSPNTRMPLSTRE